MKKFIAKTTIATLLASLFLQFPISLAADFETGVTNGEYMDYMIRTEHFQIEYNHIVSIQPDSDGDGIPNMVEEMAEYSEESWDVEIDDLGYEEPIENNEYIVVIVDYDYEYLLSGMVGMTTLFYDGTIYMAIDPKLSSSLIKVTIAHEFMHCIQFAQDPYFAMTYWDVNFAETSAVWVEDIVYDDVKLLTVHAEVGLKKLESLSFALKGNYYQYTMLNEAEPWHKPEFDTSLEIEYLLKERFLLHADLFLIGKRYAKTDFPAGSTVQLDAITDINFGCEYYFTRMFSAFLNLNNVLGSKYFIWNNYPVQGFNFLGGIKYSF